MTIRKRIIIVVLVLISLITLTASKTTLAVSEDRVDDIFAFSDDFSNYEEGGDGSPNWETDETTWKVSKGYYLNNLRNRSYAKLISPVGKIMSVDVDVKVESIGGNNWKIAGLLIYENSTNYWHLALVESPDGTRRYIELSEMLENSWKSEIRDNKLSVSKSYNKEFEWKYNHPYKLRIELAEDSITGSVFELDGTLKWEKKYAFEGKKCVYKGLPALTTTTLEAKFDNFNVTISKIENRFENKIAKSYPKFNVQTNPNISGVKTGFFHTEKINDKWWVIAPDGNAFFAVATSHISYKGFNCEALGYAPYGKNTELIYGTEEKWAKNTVKRLKDWGFNLISSGSSLSLRYKGLAHAIAFNFGSKFCSYGEDFAIYLPNDKYKFYFPNVFNPDFKDYCEKRVRSIIQNNQESQDDPWLFGYFLDNELAWWGKSFDTSYGLTDSIIEKNSNHTAKIAIMNWLKNKYSSIDKLNIAWGTNYSSFETLQACSAFDGKNQSVINSDKTDFEKIIIEKYFSITTEAVKKYDSNHMILGCSYETHSGYSKCYDLVWEFDGKYSDICSTNYYGRVNLDTETAYNNVILNSKKETLPLNEIFQSIYKKAQKPIMISEWSFPAYDSGLPCTIGAGMKVNTQSDRAKAFEIYQKAIFKMPFLVGSEFFMWVDPPAQGILSKSQMNSNYGLVNEKDEPYILLTNTAKKINNLVYDFHLIGD